MKNFNSVLKSIITNNEPRKTFYSEYKDEFKNGLDKIIPEIQISIKTPQRSLWHIYPVFDHILESIKEVNALSQSLSKGEQDMLSYIMLFHDLGKPKCRKEKIKNGQVYDTFHNHNIESEKIARKTLPVLDFAKELDIMCKLILDHDFFIAISNDFYDNEKDITIIQNAVNKKIEELNNFGDGKHLMYLLCLIGMADNLAQNLKLSSDTIYVINIALKYLDTI